MTVIESHGQRRRRGHTRTRSDVRFMPSAQHTGRCALITQKCQKILRRRLCVYNLPLSRALKPWPNGNGCALAPAPSVGCALSVDRYAELRAPHRTHCMSSSCPDALYEPFVLSLSPSRRWASYLVMLSWFLENDSARVDMRFPGPCTDPPLCSRVNSTRGLR